jgi:HEAT repeat protein
MACPLHDQEALVAAVPGMLMMLASPNPTLRHRAVDALECMGSRMAEARPLRPAVAPLIEALADADPVTREHAASALGALADNWPDDCAELSEPAIAPLARVLSEGTPEERVSAAFSLACVLGRLPNSERFASLIPGLSAALHDPGPNLRVQACRALAQLALATPADGAARRQAVQALEEALNDDLPGVHVRALRALQDLGGLEGVVSRTASEAITLRDEHDASNAARER